MVIEYLTKEQVAERLKVRKGLRSLGQLRDEIVRVTGGELSYSHLSNIMHCKRDPNEAVLKYLGGSAANVYQINGPKLNGNRKAKR